MNAPASNQTGRGSGLIFFTFQRGTQGTGLRQLDRRDVFRWVKVIARAAVPHKPDVTPHCLRHTFVTLTLDAGVPLSDVQGSAGHASTDTTRRYDRDRRPDRPPRDVQPGRLPRPPGRG